MRFYAIGDIHGRADLLRRLLTAMEIDHRSRGRARTRTILLGDMIDRGADSAALLRLLTRDTPPGLICLLGNHEAALLDAYRGDLETLRGWIDYGGRETLIGFGLSAREVDEAGPEELLVGLRRVVPAACIDWLARRPLSHVSGDYLFVHAGIRPGIPLRRQLRDDLLWIREPFLSDERWHGKVVVHGHTPVPEVDIRTNRIAVDTGAYSSGRLCALGLEGTERWIVEIPGPIPDVAPLAGGN